MKLRDKIIEKIKEKELRVQTKTEYSLDVPWDVKGNQAKPKADLLIRLRQENILIFVEIETGMGQTNNVIKYISWLRTSPKFDRGILIHVMPEELKQGGFGTAIHVCQEAGYRLKQTDPMFGYKQILYSTDFSAKVDDKQISQLADRIVTYIQEWINPFSQDKCTDSSQIQEDPHENS